MFAPHTHKPPSGFALMMESRAVLEFGAFSAAGPFLRAFPKGDGHPVMFLPGFIAPEFTIDPMKRVFAELGYAAAGWELGQNLGLRPGLFEKLYARLETLHRLDGRKVSLVGWSLGGIFAREMAKLAPEKVRLVISMGSPFAGHPRSTHVWRLYEWIAGHSVDSVPHPAPTHLPDPPPVPTTAIYTKGDGIVPWEACRNSPGPQVENIEVPGSHCGLGVNPAALYAVADRLAQPEGHWAPFTRHGWRSFVFGDPHANHPQSASGGHPGQAVAPRPHHASARLSPQRTRTRAGAAGGTRHASRLRP